MPVHEDFCREAEIFAQFMEKGGLRSSSLEHNAAHPYYFTIRPTKGCGKPRVE
jgi:hypothetical protein